MNEQDINIWIGKLASWLVSGAGGAGLLILFMKFWGQKWIENNFAINLEAFKAQKLHEFDLLLTRKVKWHEKEHEVLSESWKLLVEAHRTLKAAINPLKEFPDLETMTEDLLGEFFEREKFSKEEIIFIKDYRDGKNIAFSRVLNIRSLNEAQKAFSEFHKYFDDNKIFLRPHIKGKFQEVADHIWDAWVSKKMSHHHQDGDIQFLKEALNTEKTKIAPLIKEIEDVVQNELFE